MKPRHSKPIAAEPSSWVARLSAFGLFLGIALALARAGMTETLREPFEPTPGASTLPRSPGPGASLLLDLLCWLPAVLALARAALDSTFRIRWTWLVAPLALLGLLAPLSALWAADRFAALVKGMHFLSALVLLWGISQLVRRPVHLWIVAGACTGLLLVLIVNSLQERLVNFPIQKADWFDRNSASSRWAYMQQQGLAETDFAFQQFERKLLSGELRGFGNSSNTLAAVVVMLTFVAAGAAIQRCSDSDPWGWTIALALLLPGTLFCLHFTHSRVAMLTLVLGGVLLLVLWRFGPWVAGHARLCYWIGVAAFLMVSAAVIGHGLRHDSLIEKSLTFRWYYWKGAARMVAERPILGVGWEGFGSHYTRVRLPQAVEEVKDPHNMLVKAASELGLPGLLLMAAFLARLWWEMTATRRETADLTESPAPVPGRTILLLALLAGMVHLAFAIDWDFPNSAFLLLGAVATFGGAGLLSLGLFLVVGGAPALSETVWLRRGMVIGAGMFLFQNLIDFSLFETSAMFVFVVIAGAALAQSGEPAADARSSPILPRVLCAAGIVSMLCLARLAWIPITRAESDAAAGDALVHAGRFGDAAVRYADAFARVPYNADYAYRASLALQFGGAPQAQVRHALEAAALTNPSEARYPLRQAQLEARHAAPDLRLVREGYDRALALDPRNVGLRLSYAETLVVLKDLAGARQQFDLALQHDEALPKDEPKRLSAARRAEIRGRIPGISTP